MLRNVEKMAEYSRKRLGVNDYAPEILFNDEDKKILNETFKKNKIKKINKCSFEIEIDGGNSSVIPSQYLYYAVAVRESAINFRKYMDVFDRLKKEHMNLANNIKENSFDESSIGLDSYSNGIFLNPFRDKKYRLEAKDIINNDKNADSYKFRGTEDFFGSVILKIINVPDSSSNILGKIIYELSGLQENYMYFENRILPYFSCIIRGDVISNFVYETMIYLYYKGELNKLLNLLKKNKDPDLMSFKTEQGNLTSIFRVSDKLLEESDLSSGDKSRYFSEPFLFDNKYYYLSTEWTNERDSRLDLKNFISIFNYNYKDLFIETKDQLFELKLKKKYRDIDIDGTKFIGENKIFYGAPGSGKSHKVWNFLKDVPETRTERVTFHPEFDNASFVGCYKPITEKNEEGKEEIKYKFVHQVFTDIYINAWNDSANKYYLIIEEINRGNCAEIFGELFQLLDRDSKYSISPSKELKEHLEKNLKGEGLNGIKDGKMILPSNLSIFATMNTSDQSLYPMDSAFKRRWDWEYVPINYLEKNEDGDDNVSYKYIVRLDENTSFKWIEFIEKVNRKIKDNPNLGMDKCIGNYFVKAKNIEISIEEFINKVVFYLWNDVFKDEERGSENIFEDKTSYEDFFPIQKNGVEMVKKIVENLGLINNPAE